MRTYAWFLAPIIGVRIFFTCIMSKERLEFENLALRMKSIYFS